MRVLIAAILTLVSTISIGQQYPDYPSEAETIDPERELESLGTFNGVWDGFLEVNYDPMGFYRDTRAGVRLRIIINGGNVQVQLYENGNPVRLAVENYIYGVEGTAMINTVNRNDGFVQNFSIFLAHLDPNRMEGYVSLNVHNYLYRRTSPWRIIPVYGRLIMDREKKGGA